MEKELISISKLRIKKAEKNLEVSQAMLDGKYYNASLNRSYYAAFDAMRAVNELEDFNSSKHSGVISHFNKTYIKTNKFNVEYSEIIRDLSRFRELSDYSDRFNANKREAQDCLEKAKKFVAEVKDFLKEEYK